MGVRIADVNSDGLPDIIQGFEDANGVNHFNAWINTGSGWVASSTWDPPVVFSNNGVDTGARIADVNGDGLPDIIQAYSDSGGTAHYGAWINDGDGWGDEHRLDAARALHCKRHDRRGYETCRRER